MTTARFALANAYRSNLTAMLESICLDRDGSLEKSYCLCHRGLDQEPSDPCCRQWPFPHAG